VNFFVINPGSTSTKIAVFAGRTCKFERVSRHDPEDLKHFNTAISQMEYRFKAVKEIIRDKKVDMTDIDAFVGRGGLLRPLASGTYIIDNKMLEDLKSAKYGNHASNLGAILAAGFAVEYGKPAFTANPVVVDELMEEARITGLPNIKRRSVFHALNQKAAAMSAANMAGIDYSKGKFIVVHLGGGISVGAHDMGRVVDVNNALEEGPFSPERAGSLPVMELVGMCFSGQYTEEEINKMLVGRGGLYAYTGTTDVRRIEEMAKKNAHTKLVLDAMIYRISREICACAAALFGKIDRIVVTGGLAHSRYIVEGLKSRVSFLEEIIVLPGEDEMSALVESVLRVYEGKEQALFY
jgi:butyrate kinase